MAFIKRNTSKCHSAAEKTVFRNCKNLHHPKKSKSPHDTDIQITDINNPRGLHQQVLRYYSKLLHKGFICFLAEVFIPQQQNVRNIWGKQFRNVEFVNSQPPPLAFNTMVVNFLILDLFEAHFLLMQLFYICSSFLQICTPSQYLFWTLAFTFEHATAPSEILINLSWTTVIYPFNRLLGINRDLRFSLTLHEQWGESSVGCSNTAEWLLLYWGQNQIVK